MLSTHEHDRKIRLVRDSPEKLREKLIVKDGCRRQKAALSCKVRQDYTAISPARQVRMLDEDDYLGTTVTVRELFFSIFTKNELRECSVFPGGC